MSDGEVVLKPALPMVEIGSRAEWRAWLEEHHTQPTGVWVITRRRAALRDGETYVAASDLSEECLCFGWVDTKPAPLDATRTGLLCSPRPDDRELTKVERTRIARMAAEGLVVVSPPSHLA